MSVAIIADFDWSANFIVLLSVSSHKNFFLNSQREKFFASRYTRGSIICENDSVFGPYESMRNGNA